MNIKSKLKKHKRLFNALSWINLYIHGIKYNFFMTLFKIFPIQNKCIVIVNFSGKGYGDNGKYIVEQLIKKEHLDYKIIWAIKKDNEAFPQNVKTVKIDSIKFIFYLTVAHIWINNSRMPFGMKKRKKQFYIQTWHSTLRLKKIEKDAEELLTKPYIAKCKKDSKMIDLIISGSKFSTNTFKNSFWYNGKIIETGTPRCDLFFKKNNKEQLKKNISKRFLFDVNKKIILYAPTFRKDMEEKKAYINWNNLSGKISNDYVILERFHPISNYSIKEEERIKDVTSYEDIQELLSISDFLVTDYSGCCFDMLINNKPCILYIKDINEYIKKERNLYFDFSELPFPIAKNEEELIEIIKNFDYKEYDKKRNSFCNTVGLIEDGKASEKIVNIIEEIINEKV